MLYAGKFELPQGELLILEEDGGLINLSFSHDVPDNAEVKETPLIKQLRLELGEYFAGKRKFFNIKLAPKGTQFQQKVWAALQEIPYGKTVSYKDIAIKIGNHKAVRAVGMANNRNPLAIIVPCHRVIGSNGQLVGYAGGIEMKKYLLNLEAMN